MNDEFRTPKKSRHNQGRENVEVDIDKDKVHCYIDASQMILSPISTQTKKDVVTTWQVPVTILIKIALNFLISFFQT